MRDLLRDYQLLARLEEQDRRALASVFALGCDRARATQAFEVLPASPDNTSDLAALQLDDPRARADILGKLDQVLKLQPRHPQARWNRALMLAALDLPRAAARDFRLVAALGEPGWAEEARQRAHRLEQTVKDDADQGAAIERAVAVIEKGELPARDVVTGYPERIRIAFHKAVRDRPPGHGADLVPLGQRLDAILGGQSLAAIAAGQVDLNRMMDLTR